MLSALVLDHVHSPRNTGELSTATHHGVADVPGEGPYLRLWLEVSDETIVRASYSTYGCPAANASGCITAQVLVGRTISQALLLTSHGITLLLGGLPEGKEHSPQLAITALHDALSDLGGSLE
jgi:NifU-like protein involved in Fe-S cluster formation